MTSGRFFNGWTLTALLLVVVIIAGSVVIGLKCRGSQAVEITLMQEHQITGNIYIGGAVNNPGYYPVFVGDTLEGIIGAAGGLKIGADSSDIELDISGLVEETVQKIDINRAPAWLLEALPGVGASKAQDIIDYRQQHGLFRDINELMNVPGFGDISFSKIKDLITVND